MPQFSGMILWQMGMSVTVEAKDEFEAEELIEQIVERIDPNTDGRYVCDLHVDFVEELDA